MFTIACRRGKILATFYGADAGELPPRECGRNPRRVIGALVEAEAATLRWFEPLIVPCLPRCG